jgi:hypothetical protein
MRGFYVMALLAIVGLTVASGTATAGLPDPAQSSVEDVVVGTLTGAGYDAPGTFGTSAQVWGDGFEVIVRDINGTPVGGATVTITFAGGFNPYDTQVAPATVNCPTKTVSLVADVNGRAVFFTLGGGFENTSIAQVSANGVPLKTVLARSPDLEPAAGGDGDVDIFDQLEFFKRRFPTGGPLFNSIEADYDGDTNVTIFDQLLFFQQRFAGISWTPCP